MILGANFFSRFRFIVLLQKLQTSENYEEIMKSEKGPLSAVLFKISSGTTLDCNWNWRPIVSELPEFLDTYFSAWIFWVIKEIFQ